MDNNTVEIRLRYIGETGKILHITDESDYTLWLESQLRLIEVMETYKKELLKIVWHKYPDKVPEDIEDKWVTLKDNSVNLSWYNKDTGWAHFFDGEIIAWADITYPEPYREEK
jgi:hypothetical protein